ncbi:3-hydroxyacyl-[acyl-carrier-protein] dehydratase, mitochondrial-like [Aegilops tauschii subsp. strangulata]|uniref:3-hydroxyacyl-[acyl-carrier-protein] dehydratase, mitochondrial-like n=1 Tax=Aegilops tauschii subsp. strangulata TaxID=200361 RepID=UPI00098A92FC|nr:(R)-specific enoyl-CoA hydratase-like [Aegilops tauschii subsp. strangulata]
MGLAMTFAHFVVSQSSLLVCTAVTAASANSVAALKAGDTLRSRRRRFTENDVAAYAGVSSDRNPVHLDDAFARGVGGFQRDRVVHGMLIASLFPALITSHFPRAVGICQSLKFAAPVYIGDEVVAQVQALHIKAAGARHIVKFATKCFTADEETLAIDGEAMASLPTLQLSTEAID